MAFTLPEQKYVIPQRKTYGAKPTVVTDESQIPSVIIDEKIAKKIAQLGQPEQDKNTGGPEIGSPSPPPPNSGSPTFPTPKTMAPKIGGATKNRSESISSIDLELELRLKVGIDCIRMLKVISTIANETGEEWVRIGRDVFESVGVNGDRILNSRLEGVENKLFEFNEVKKISKKTGKEYTDHFIYRLMK